MQVTAAKHSAFSLIELSIVLVILGLLTGGILAGQSLIRASEMRSVISDFERYSTATQAFRDKYQNIPGDMNNATQFWGFSGTVVSPGCVTRSGAAIVAPGTCDGDGDGIIEYGAAASATGEAFQAWKQLAFAGLVEGSYSGNAGPLSASDYVLGTNSPRSKIANVSWMLSYIDNTGGTISGHMFDYNYLGWMGTGTEVNAGGSWADDGFLKNEEAWNIDTKLDDGKPATGSVHAMGLDYGCTTTPPNVNTDHTVLYNLSATTANACALLFKR